jgi:hypothetical protein
VDGTGSGSCAVVSFGISSAETAGSATKDFLVKLHCKTTRNAGFPGTVLLMNRFHFGLSVLELKCSGGSAVHCVCLFVCLRRWLITHP